MISPTHVPRSLAHQMLAPKLAGGGPVLADVYIDFEASTDGTVVTDAILTSATKGNIDGNVWRTYSNAEGLTLGAIPSATISTSAACPHVLPVSVGGVLYNSAGTRGMRVNCSANGAIGLAINENTYRHSIAFFLRYNGPAVNNSPRDIMGMIDLLGAFQYLQFADNQPGNPTFHTHQQFTTDADNVGTEQSFQRNKWYFFTAQWVRGGERYKLRCYDPASSYALVAESQADALMSGVSTAGARYFFIGLLKYGDPTQSGQSVDIDNVIIRADGGYPYGV
jgi:hypothetical protein